MSQSMVTETLSLSRLVSRVSDFFATNTHDVPLDHDYASIQAAAERVVGELVTNIELARNLIIEVIDSDEIPVPQTIAPGSFLKATTKLEWCTRQIIASITQLLSQNAEHFAEDQRRKAVSQLQPLISRVNAMLDRRSRPIAWTFGDDDVLSAVRSQIALLSAGDRARALRLLEQAGEEIKPASAPPKSKLYGPDEIHWGSLIGTLTAMIIRQRAKEQAVLHDKIQAD